MDNIESALSTQKIAMVFVRCLIGVWILAIILTVLFALKFPKENSISAKKSMYGIWKNEPFYMSPDFDEPLEDFAEYM